MKKLILFVLVFGLQAIGQSKVETIANFGVTSVDMVKTCYNLYNGGREYWTPSQNCATVAGLNYGRATAAFLLDNYLAHHGHSRWAHFQLVSAGISAAGVSFSFRKDF